MSKDGLGVASINCCLWFNRCRISDASEIVDNFDLPALRGYFLGGNLTEWLREHGGSDYADSIAKIDPSSPNLDSQLAAVFGVTYIPEKKVFTGKVEAAAVLSGGEGSGSKTGSGKNMLHGSGNVSLGSAAGSGLYGYWSGYGSYGGYGSSGSWRKLSTWEWEWEWRTSGKKSGSFRLGSYGYGSFAFGMSAYLNGSFSWYSGSYNQVFMTSYTNSSFRPAGSYPFWVMTVDEYDRIMYETLRICPLDCFGYGIHII